MSNLWWLSASPEELRSASTCRDCGCGDADIDLGLCYDCFCQRNEQQQKKLVEAATAKYQLPPRTGPSP